MDDFKVLFDVVKGFSDSFYHGYQGGGIALHIGNLHLGLKSVFFYRILRPSLKALRIRRRAGNHDS
jgi:hypothetical protein